MGDGLLLMDLCDREAECRGKALPFTYPGIRNLERYGMDDALSSVQCDLITGWKSHP